MKTVKLSFVGTAKETLGEFSCKAFLDSAVDENVEDDQGEEGAESQRNHREHCGQLRKKAFFKGTVAPVYVDRPESGMIR